jgi:hypothetical protein
VPIGAVLPMRPVRCAIRRQADARLFDTGIV